jgi:hypothetical protein
MHIQSWADGDNGDGDNGNGDVGDGDHGDGDHGNGVGGECDDDNVDGVGDSNHST